MDVQVHFKSDRSSLIEYTNEKKKQYEQGRMKYFSFGIRIRFKKKRNEAKKGVQTSSIKLHII